MNNYVETTLRNMESIQSRIRSINQAGLLDGARITAATIDDVRLLKRFADQLANEIQSAKETSQYHD